MHIKNTNIFSVLQRGVIKTSKIPSYSKKIHGFTLVELIVVITILVILGTIAFLSLSGYSGSARDSSRVSDLANLSRGLEITYAKSSFYPMPDNSINITYSGGVLWNQGTIGDGVINIIGSAGGVTVSKKPTDPLFVTKEYNYSKLAYGNGYQIKTDWEGDMVAYHNSIINQANAAPGNPIISYIKGNYNGLLVKTETGSLVYLLAAPSIITSQTGAIGESIDSVSNLSNKFFIHGQTNSGGIAYVSNSSKFLVYSAASLPSTTAEKQNLAINIANAYSGTTLATQSNIQPYIAALATSDIAALSNLGGSATTNLGGTTTTDSGNDGIKVPGAPINLVGTGSNGTINLSWSAPTDNGGSSIVNYKVYWGTGSNSYTNSSLVAGNTTTYSISSFPTEGAVYYFAVTAINVVGEGVKSGETYNDPYWSNVVLAMHMDGMNGSTSFTDSSTSPQTVTNTNNVTLITNATTSKNGGSSARFLGSTRNYLTVQNSNLYFGTNDFTIEGWYYMTSYTAGYDQSFIASNWSGAWGPTAWWVGRWQGAGGKVIASMYGATMLTDPVAPSLNTWYHYAVVKKGTSFKLFRNGTLVDSGTISTSQGDSTRGVTIGSNPDNVTLSGVFTGYMDDVRVTNGVGRYSSNFTPSATTFPNR
ncbi:MAG: fibronectin type III domain-containing protein [Candidatus Gracilibacteria bacterium]|nr:fibronectin type III domain-containing protein [Candidatus Gracilibacteria bacterium]